MLVPRRRGTKTRDILDKGWNSKVVRHASEVISFQGKVRSWKRNPCVPASGIPQAEGANTFARKPFSLKVRWLFPALFQERRRDLAFMEHLLPTATLEDSQHCPCPEGGPPLALGGVESHAPSPWAGVGPSKAVSLTLLDSRPHTPPPRLPCERHLWLRTEMQRSQHDPRLCSS